MKVHQYVEFARKEHRLDRSEHRKTTSDAYKIKRNDCSHRSIGIHCLEREVLPAHSVIKGKGGQKDRIGLCDWPGGGSEGAPWAGMRFGVCFALGRYGVQSIDKIERMIEGKNNTK